MKNILNTVIHIKLNACIIFTITSIAILVVNLFSDALPITTTLLWQSLLICFVGAIIQCVAFSQIFFKKMNYIARSTIFIVPFLSFLSGCAIWFDWFPADKIGYWLIFKIIFIIAFIFISVGFEIYYKITGTHYNEQLENYKRSKTNNGNSGEPLTVGKHCVNNQSLKGLSYNIFPTVGYIALGALGIIALLIIISCILK